MDFTPTKDMHTAMIIRIVEMALMSTFYKSVYEMLLESVWSWSEGNQSSDEDLDLISSLCNVGKNTNSYLVDTTYRLQRSCRK